MLTEAEEAIVVEFRRRTLLPLDDVLGCLRETIPRLSRSALHRCLQRHGISRLPGDEEKASKRKRFAETRIGYVHIDVCELRLAEGKLIMFLAIDRVSKFAHVAFHANTKMATGAAFLPTWSRSSPTSIHTVLTDNGMAFADLPKNRDGPSTRLLGGHIFDRVCDEHGIEHRLTKPYHPWTNGQAERMNRTVKDATVKVFHYADLRASGRTSWPSSRPTTSPSTSRRCDGEPLSRPSATPGPRTRQLQDQPAPPHPGTKHLAFAQAVGEVKVPVLVIFPGRDNTISENDNYKSFAEHANELIEQTSASALELAIENWPGPKNDFAGTTPAGWQQLFRSHS